MGCKSLISNVYLPLIMEYYLEASANNEIKEAAESGICAGINAHVDLMRSVHDEPVNVVADLCTHFPLTHITVVGQKAHELIHEVHKLLHHGLVSEKMVFRFAATYEGIQACRKLQNDNISVHLESIGSMQQAWLAMEAGAAWISTTPTLMMHLGSDAFATARECLVIQERYSYPTRFMFCAAQSTTQVKEALSEGVQAISSSFALLKESANHKLALSASHESNGLHRLMHLRVGDVIKPNNPTVNQELKIADAVVEMSKGGMGAVAIVNHNGELLGIFTDGDLRRQIQQKGHAALGLKLTELTLKKPASIERSAFLIEAAELLKSLKIDNLLVTDNGRLIGMLDIQDLNT
jgi:transaldolase